MLIWNIIGIEQCNYRSGTIESKSKPVEMLHNKILMQKAKSTIQKIADELGLSKSTVSRALKDHPDITKKTKKLVWDTAKSQGYQPNQLARNLKNNRTNIIGIIVPDIERPFYAAFISGVQERASEQQFFTVNCQSKDSYLTEISHLKALSGLGVDGIMICHSRETHHFSELQKLVNQGIPLLAIDRELTTVKSHLVGTDHFIAGFMIGEHLAENGYRQIAIIAGPAKLTMSNLRVEGCIEGLKTAGITMNDDNIFYCDFDQDRELSVVTKILAMKERPDAIFCVYDKGAISILKFLLQKNISVPGAMGIAGCGNDPITEYLNPGLTTVEQQPNKMGALAAEILINHIITQNSSNLSRQVIRPRLVVRASTQRSSQ